MKKLILALALVAPSCASVRPVHRLESSTFLRVEELTPQVDPKEFQRCVEALAKQQPLDYPAHIVVSYINGPYLGITWFDALAGQYEVRLESHVSSFTLYDTLAHEWAHARTWRMPRADGEPHDATWGVEMAAAYMTILKTRMTPDPAPMGQQGILPFVWPTN